MSKKQKNKKRSKVLLIPGEYGWEVWAGDKNLELKTSTKEHSALELNNLPNGELTMAFGVREFISLPFRANTGDEGMFDDMAQMHLERSGVRAEEAYGTLRDTFVVEKNEDNVLLLPIVLSAPKEGDLPKRTPSLFDVSVRCYKWPKNSVVLYREFGRWVMGVTQGNNLLYSQVMSTPVLGADLGSEARISVTQLVLQGVIEQGISEVVVWLPGGGNLHQEEADALEQGIGVNIRTEDRPDPFLPEKPSKLLPSDVRAQRVAIQQRKQRNLLVTVGLVLYLGLVGYLGWNLYTLQGEAKLVETKMKRLRPETGMLADLDTKWTELQPVVESNHWPVEQFFRVVEAAPPGGISITRAEMRNELQAAKGAAGQRLVREIMLEGETEEVEFANMLDKNLKSSTLLSEYEWQTPSASQTNKGTWKFSYTGVYK